jgi:transcriptional regulator with XRE-family HTH domain
MTRAATSQPNDAATEFGALVRRYRLGAGLTQESLAELADLSTRGLQCLESGARHPYPATARRLAAALAVDSEQLERFFMAGRWRPWRPGR